MILISVACSLVNNFTLYCVAVYRMTMPMVNSSKLFSKITEAAEQGLEIF
jgi:hypothetical protein